MTTAQSIKDGLGQLLSVIAYLGAGACLLYMFVDPLLGFIGFVAAGLSMAWIEKHLLSRPLRW